MVLYAGNAEDRGVIFDNELFFQPPGRGDIFPHQCKVEALLVSYEMLLKEKSMFSRFRCAERVGMRVARHIGSNIEGSRICPPSGHL